MKIIWQWRTKLEVFDMYMSHSIQVVVNLKTNSAENGHLNHSGDVSFMYQIYSIKSQSLPNIMQIIR
jgi:hypothetical protein